ncbi:MAG: DEAD/DEAH box helicase [Polyangiaceae bacterium]
MNPSGKKPRTARDNVLERFHEPTRRWFTESFPRATDAQLKAWPSILAGESTLLVAPTGSGKTLAAFLCGIDRLLIFTRS